MRKILNRLLLLSAALGTADPSLAQEDFELIVEGGPAIQLRNDFAVPGDTGTLVRLEDDETTVTVRATLWWRFDDRWSARLVGAPLSTETSLTPDSAVTFQDQTFIGGREIQVDYRFDSWRLGAVYDFSPRGSWHFRAGLTLKVRDAEIALSNGTRKAVKDDTGVVPLLYLGADYRVSDRMSWKFDLDGAAASQGRAIDASIRGDWSISDRISLQLGARVLDGGADNDEVYSFATFAYGFGGISFRF